MARWARAATHTGLVFIYIGGGSDCVDGDGWTDGRTRARRRAAGATTGIGFFCGCDAAGILGGGTQLLLCGPAGARAAHQSYWTLTATACKWGEGPRGPGGQTKENLGGGGGARRWVCVGRVP